MQMRPKPISEQVIVITGGSSGLGLATARLAARGGAKVVLAARNERDLGRAVEQIRVRGGRAIYVAADVAFPEEVEELATAAIREFGRIDTWVNNAAVSMYGKTTALELRDMRRQFEVNFWGTVHGSLTAVRHFGERGGTLINVASVLADRAVPLQGIYCASKHAVKAFTDTLRMELELDRRPVAVVLVKPGSMDTPFFEKAKSYLGEEPQPLAPVYAPEVVARTILHAARHPVREVTAGGIAGLLSLAQRLSPTLTDRYLERFGVDGQTNGRPLGPERRDNLHSPLDHDGGERGRNWDGRVLERSALTWARLHPDRAAVAALGLGAAAFLGARALRRVPPAAPVRRGRGGPRRRPSRDRR